MNTPPRLDPAFYAWVAGTLKGITLATWDQVVAMLPNVAPREVMAVIDTDGRDCTGKTADEIAELYKELSK